MMAMITSVAIVTGPLSRSPTQRRRSRPDHAPPDSAPDDAAGAVPARAPAPACIWCSGGVPAAGGVPVPRGVPVPAGPLASAIGMPSFVSNIVDNIADNLDTTECRGQGLLLGLAPSA